MSRKTEIKTGRNKQPKPALKDREVLKVGLRFCAIALVLNFGVWYLGMEKCLTFLDIFTSKVITDVLHISGLNARRAGHTIYLAHSAWMVVNECTAINLMAIYSSFILAYPSSLKAKGIALMSGISFIFGANIVRLLIMGWIDKLKPQYSTFFHDYIWEVFFIIMVALMWIVWVEKVVNGETKTPVSG